MKKYFLITCASLFTFLACGKNSNSPYSPIDFDSEKVEWQLVWADDFDKEGLPNTEIWSYEEGYVRNNETQFYTKERTENARIEGGNLIIEARSDNWNGNPITSASIHTYGKKAMLYGKIEVRAKLPTGKGTWPAIWMLGNSFREGTKWPDCGEIDIMENVGYDPDIIHANIHTKAYNHSIGTGKGDKIVIDKPYNDFHIYTVEWFDKEMRFYVDDELYFTYKNDGAGKDSWPFNKPHYLILNLAIGGSWGGQDGIADDLLPQKYYVDYVKVYEQK